MRGMCVVALARNAHPDWPLILVGNRDEFHGRPAAPLHAWDDGSGIVGGRDLQAGGTWLGVRQPRGRAIVVTNVRGAMPDPAKESRGALVVDMLRGDGCFADPVADDLATLALDVMMGEAGYGRSGANPFLVVAAD